MREMKDSGIEWIGEIPKHWKCCKQKYGLTLLNGRAFKESEFLEDGKYKVLRVGNLFTNPIWHYSNLMLEDNKYCQKGDLLYSWSMSYAPFIWRGDKVIYHYHIWKVLIDDILCKKFVYYYLLALTEALYAEIHETTMGFITMGIMNNSYLSYCNLEEQQQIANFLDTQCSKIDATAEDIQKEISLLEDYKKSVITEAVTTGLNPDAEMKDSGIEWIGEIPKEWSVVAVKHCFYINNGSDPITDEGEIPVYGSGSKSFKTCKESKEGPTVLLGRKGTINIPQWIESRYWNVDTAFDVKAKGNYDLKLFYYCAVCFDYERYTTQTALPSMTQGDYKNFKIPYMNFYEQKDIVKFLDSKCSEIDTLIADKKRQLDILADYKKSLIYEYVTGKKEVPVNE